TIARFGVEGATAPDFLGGINVSKTGVEGVDIVVPEFKFSVTKTFSPAQMTGAYVQTVYLMTGRMNHANYVVKINGTDLTFERGELRF
ncbi:hypothetical protein U2075_14815, partial [Listeria monocytogenes]|uniref:hypothetical protein n=1 Tax=Listeria monocytogenes TaxID=1639 RepID=UPI002FDBCD78